MSEQVNFTMEEAGQMQALDSQIQAQEPGMDEVNVELEELAREGQQEWLAEVARRPKLKTLAEVQLVVESFDFEKVVELITAIEYDDVKRLASELAASDHPVGKLYAQLLDPTVAATVSLEDWAGKLMKEPRGWRYLLTRATMSNPPVCRMLLAALSTIDSRN